MFKELKMGFVKIKIATKYYLNKAKLTFSKEASNAVEF
jgi:hypothetical protein